jgi:predicted Rossmann fold flavoprotein
MHRSIDIIVIGGGPAGLMAAGSAAECGAQVLLLEKMNRPGRKLCITGKGRCNLTSALPIEDHLDHFGRNGLFLRQAFYRFSNTDLIDFFITRGIPTVTERGNRVFPASQNARDVVDALVTWIKRRHVTIQCKTPVKKLVIRDGRVWGVRLHDNVEKTASRVIITSGGISYPATGSTGDGYRFAQQAGHAIVPLRPGLVPLETAGDCARRLQGLSLRNCAVRLVIDGKERAAEFGEMLFTHFGVSGPVILSLSRHAAAALKDSRNVEVAVDLKPALDENKLDNRIQREITECGKRKTRTLLKHLLPQKLIDVCADITGLDTRKPVNQLNSAERLRLRKWLKDVRLQVTGIRPFEEAIITSGGVALDEIDPRTMESQLVSGLYFAGEILDLDADTGGFNLQAAFSTGYVAGTAAAEKTVKTRKPEDRKTG